MPLNNSLYGVYKLLLIKKSDGSFQYVIVDSANRDRKMEVEAKNFVQGTAKNRIMNIGGLEEDIRIKAPILIGGGSAIDGRRLLNEAIENALDPNATTLPILNNAEIEIGEQGANISIGLKSDGNPRTQAFQLSSIGADGIAGQPLNPSAAGGPTRVGRFYDFRVNLAGYKLYVMEARIQLEVEIQKKYFIPGADYPTAPGNNDTDPVPDDNANANPFDSSPTLNPYNFGTQYPTMGVAGIKVSGSGKAACELREGDTKDYDFGDYEDALASINVSLDDLGTNYELTRQLPGQVRQFSDDRPGENFKIEVWNPEANSGDGGWESLFLKYGTDTLLFDLSHALIDKADFQVNPGLLTLDFGFKCWVK